jgi:dihydroorotate dehydrogenase electron transfer subunit
MDNPLHAEFYADHLAPCSCPIVENVCLARDTYRVRLLCPEIAQRITPGQFVMLRLHGCNDPLIGRPFAMYDVHASTANAGYEWLDVVYLKKGKLSSRLAGLGAGDYVDIWGPLGNGFLPQPTEHLIMVAGGIGQTPFFSLAQEYLGRKQFGDSLREVTPAQKITFCYGARSAEYFAGLPEFEALGIELRLSTDDGSHGHHGLVTDLLKQTLAETAFKPRVVCCGPEPMMEAVAHICHDAHVPCEVSLETPMACGIGICFTCVAMVEDRNGERDYKRTCVEGPVFPGSKIVWK